MGLRENFRMDMSERLERHQPNPSLARKFYVAASLVLFYLFAALMMLYLAFLVLLAIFLWITESDRNPPKQQDFCWDGNDKGVEAGCYSDEYFAGEG